MSSLMKEASTQEGKLKKGRITAEDVRKATEVSGVGRNQDFCLFTCLRADESHEIQVLDIDALDQAALLVQIPIVIGVREVYQRAESTRLAVLVSLREARSSDVTNSIHRVCLVGLIVGFLVECFGWSLQRTNLSMYPWYLKLVEFDA